MSSTTVPAKTSTYAEATEAEKQAVLRKVTGSSFLGNFIEWFDYASYSYLATVIALVFFPAEDRFVGVMSAFAVFALSFLVRPIGAIFWGNMGDKKGRKWALSVSILLMSGATFLIGCLPGYAMIGVGAPLLLLVLRMVQSFSAAGEYAGAATFIAEYAPKNHRGFYCSMVRAFWWALFWPRSCSTPGAPSRPSWWTGAGAFRSGWRCRWAISLTTSALIWRIPRCTPRCRIT